MDKNHFILFIVQLFYIFFIFYIFSYFHSSGIFVIFDPSTHPVGKSFCVKKLRIFIIHTNIFSLVSSLRRIKTRLTFSVHLNVFQIKIFGFKSLLRFFARSVSFFQCRAQIILKPIF